MLQGLLPAKTCAGASTQEIDSLKLMGQLTVF